MEHPPKSEWKSPRAQEHESILADRKLFDNLFEQVDRGEITRKMAIHILKNETVFDDEESLF